MKMPSGLVNLLVSRSTLLSGRTPQLHCKAVLRGNIMQNLVARFNGVLTLASGGDLVLKQLEKKLYSKEMPFTVRWRLLHHLIESDFFLILRISTEKSLNYKTSTCESST